MSEIEKVHIMSDCLIEHEEKERCWCNPEIEKDGDIMIIKHRNVFEVLAIISQKVRNSPLNLDNNKV